MSSLLRITSFPLLKNIIICVYCLTSLSSLTQLVSGSATSLEIAEDESFAMRRNLAEEGPELPVIPKLKIEPNSCQVRSRLFTFTVSDFFDANAINLKAFLGGKNYDCC